MRLWSRPFLQHALESARRLLGGKPCKRQVAALPWRPTATGVEVMLITSRDTGRWVLPKGWPEKRESLHEAAAREAAEEAGLSGVIESSEAGRYFYGKVKSSGRRLRCEVLVYPMLVEDVASRWPERQERERAWFSPSEAAAKVRERDLAELLAHFRAPRHAVAA